ncbi:E3 ubiquitin-protein ligase SH3RF1-like isoform X2 [Artemia franciscana]|uniref:RING-type E3 ubiquitin transferase n=1 Tax=Artemia franciscana TaxID=6661 RepID=A0AA88L4E7_ARTSF|nr:hypothetical protein QYM36_011149 [Artemia franciscana]KAK2712361.1 hypothetical protein QYM36_011149 [Artemia franciscana]
MKVMDVTALDDLLECSVCLERLDIKNKVLPCQHTFCKKCLEEILTTHKELRCPECRILINVRIDDLPPNVLLVRILEGMKNVPPGKETIRPAPKVQSPAVVLPPVAESSEQVPQIEPAGRTQPLLQPTILHRRYDFTIPQIDLETPCAKALYNFDAQEPGDLSFKKGDVIQLRRQIDPNWYLGELRGQQGFFPATYVQVLVPLSTHPPLCKALYDFKMTNDDEKDCLAFSKGESIIVTRRIDENWAEGKLNDRIGIFPISFVEMNAVAKAMMKSYVNSSPGSSRPSPSISDMAPQPTTSNVSNSAFNYVTRSLQMLASQLTISTPSSSELFTSSSSTGTENTSMTQSCSPMSGSILGPLPVFGQRATGMSNSLQIPATPSLVPNLQVSSAQTGEAPVLGERQALPPPPEPTTTAVPSTHCKLPVRTREKRLSYNVARSTPSSPTRENNRRSMDIGNSTTASNLTPDAISLISHRRNNSHPTETSILDTQTPKTPELYIALYPYKPQKPDEIELKKGSLYNVIERCRDGWFIGESIRSRQTGVFPGNYVQPLRNRNGTLNSTAPRDFIQKSPTAIQQENTPQMGNSSPIVAPPKHNRRHTTALVPNGRRGKVNAPELPPRTSLQKSPTNSTPKRLVPSPKSAPSSRRGSRCENDIPGNRLMSPRKLNGRNLETEIIPKIAEKVPVAKEKVSIIQRFTRKKGSTSSIISEDNPAFEETKGITSNNLSPVLNQPHHTRLRGSDGTPGSTKQCREENPTSIGSGHFVPGSKRSKQPMPPARERYRCVTAYPPNSDHELELYVGDIVYVHKKRDDGWLKGTSQRTGRSGLFPSIFVEPI